MQIVQVISPQSNIESFNTTICTLQEIHKCLQSLFSDVFLYPTASQILYCRRSGISNFQALMEGIPLPFRTHRQGFQTRPISCDLSAVLSQWADNHRSSSPPSRQSAFHKLVQPGGTFPALVVHAEVEYFDTTEYVLQD